MGKPKQENWGYKVAKIIRELREENERLQKRVEHLEKVREQITNPMKWLEENGLDTDGV